MAQDSSLTDTLRSKAILLLKGERDLMALRNIRRRTEAWLRAFHSLSLMLHGGDVRGLIARWAELLVDQLSFEIGGAVEYEHPSGRRCFELVEPAPAESPATIPEETTASFDEHPQGTCDDEAPPAIRAFGRALGLESFFWLWLRPRPESRLLLFAGYSSRTAAYRSLPAHDHSHFMMLGNHLAALVENSQLVAQVNRERNELRAANEDLDASLRELRATKDHLISAQKLEALGRMAAGLAHEVNNPLTIVFNNLDVCRSRLADAGERGERSDPALLPALDDAMVGAERIAQIVRDVQTFATKGHPAVGNVELREPLEEALRICRNAIRHVATLSADLTGELPMVTAERRRLTQVFVNLLSNASQAMRGGPATSNHLTIAVRSEESETVVVEIRDNGRGIPREHLERVFDPFFTTHGVGQGMGLGLSVCRGILEGFGGSIALDSEVGQGTVARVSLRAAQRRVEDAEPITSEATAAGLAAPRLLIVDDEPAILSVLERTFKRLGVVVTSTSSGREAIRLAREGSFDLVLCDLMMPETSGMEIYAELAKVDPELAKRVVFMTGGAFSDETEAFLATTTNRWIHKPCARSDLLAIAERLRAPTTRD